MSEMTDLEFIESRTRGDSKNRFYVVESLEERDMLINVFKRVFENNWGVYSKRIKIQGMFV